MPERWKINSIGYGHTILGVIGVLTIMIPVVSYFCAWFLDLVQKKADLLVGIAKFSFSVGITLFALFMLFLAIEFAQDRFLDAHYSKTRNQKLRLANGRYECQYCGTQKVDASDKQCPVCGKDLK